MSECSDPKKSIRSADEWRKANGDMRETIRTMPMIRGYRFRVDIEVPKKGLSGPCSVFVVSKNLHVEVGTLRKLDSIVVARGRSNRTVAYERTIQNAAAVLVSDALYAGAITKEMSV